MPLARLYTLGDDHGPTSTTRTVPYATSPHATTLSLSFGSYTTLRAPQYHNGLCCPRLLSSTLHAVVVLTFSTLRGPPTCYNGLCRPRLPSSTPHAVFLTYYCTLRAPLTTDFLSSQAAIVYSTCGGGETFSYPNVTLNLTFEIAAQPTAHATLVGAPPTQRMESTTSYSRNLP